MICGKKCPEYQTFPCDPITFSYRMTQKSNNRKISIKSWIASSAPAVHPSNPLQLLRSAPAPPISQLKKKNNDTWENWSQRKKNAIPKIILICSNPQLLNWLASMWKGAMKRHPIHSLSLPLLIFPFLCMHLNSKCGRNMRISDKKKVK